MQYGARLRRGAWKLGAGVLSVVALVVTMFVRSLFRASNIVATVALAVLAAGLSVAITLAVVRPHPTRFPNTMG